MVPEPCLYSGTIARKRVIFKRQVDDFAIVVLDPKTMDILFDMLDDKLITPIKQHGYLHIHNGIDVLQLKIISKYPANCSWRNAVKNTLQHR
jgi:hypothetical protein